MTRLYVAGSLLLTGLVTCHAEPMVALMSDAKLRYFDSEVPGTATKIVSITGLPAGQSVVAFDHRVSAGQFYVITQEGTQVICYTVNSETGAREGVFSITGNFEGTAFGYDAMASGVPNGGVDGIIASDADRLDPTSSSGSASAKTLIYDSTELDGDPVDQHSGVNPSIVALASTNSVPEAKAVVLYGIDSGLDSLAIVNPETGQLNTVGPLGASTGTRCGFDISGTTGIAYASLGSTLYTVKLANGVATEVGVIASAFPAGSPLVMDIAVLPPTRLLNLSTRSRVGAGEDVMIAGFIARGGPSVRLIIRGIGPSLGAAGIASPLADPVLTIFDNNGTQIASNDNWKSSQQSEIVQTGLAPTNDLEAAYVDRFAPSAYTAIVSGKDGGTGVGVVEIYRLPE